MLMETLFSRLVTQVYELEGLLLVLDKHGDDTPPEVYRRIGELGQEIARRTGQLSCEPEANPMSNLKPEPQPESQPELQRELQREPQPVPEPQPELEPQPDPEAQYETHTEPVNPQPTADDLPEDDYNADETWQHDNGEEFTEVFKVDYVEPQPVVKPVPNVVLVEPRPEPDHAVAEPVQSTVDGDLRVDEKLQRTLSKDMHKALSINDRFRFQRELFSNNKNDLNNALDLVNAMQSFDEAQDYFIGDLGWDQDNEDVADFMGLVRRHFL